MQFIDFEMLNCTNERVLNFIYVIIIFHVIMPPFEEVGLYCFAHVGRSVRRQTLSDQ